MGRLAEDESFRDRFLREAELAEPIDHPNIASKSRAAGLERLETILAPRSPKPEA